MNLQKPQTEMLRADISKEERLKANRLAKSQGYTFQGWLGKVIKDALREQEDKQ